MRATEQSGRRATPRRSRALLAALVVVLAASCGGGKSKPKATSPVTVKVWATVGLKPVLTQLVTTFQKQNSSVKIEATYATSTVFLPRINRGELPDLYIDGLGAIVRVPKAKLVGKAVSVAADPLQIAVAPGNPKKITGLAVFGNDPNTKSGLCAPKTACGALAGQALTKAGVTAAADDVEQTPLVLITKVAKGDLDAALLLRSQISTHLRQVNAVTLPAKDSVGFHYALVALTKNAAASRFAQFLSGPGGSAILRAHGLLGGARRVTTPTTTR